MNISQILTASMEVILAGLLVLVLIYLIRVNKKVQALRGDHNAMKQLVAALDNSTIKAQASLTHMKQVIETMDRNLSGNVKNADAIASELGSMIQTADRIADRLQRYVAEASVTWRNNIQPGTVTQRMPNTEPLSASESYLEDTKPYTSPSVSKRSSPSQTPEDPARRKNQADFENLVPQRSIRKATHPQHPSHPSSSSSSSSHEEAIIAATSKSTTTASKPAFPQQNDVDEQWRSALSGNDNSHVTLSKQELLSLRQMIEQKQSARASAKPQPNPHSNDDSNPRHHSARESSFTRHAS